MLLQLSPEEGVEHATVMGSNEFEVVENLFDKAFQTVLLHYWGIARQKRINENLCWCQMKPRLSGLHDLPLLRALSLRRSPSPL